MLIARSPLRVSLFGGGSDLPAFLKNNEGAVLSFALDRSVFLVGHPFTHRKGIRLKYSRTEDVESANRIQHPIAREVLSRYGVSDLDLAVMADVPAGTGLGSSSAFTVAFLALVRSLKGIPSTPADLAQEACEIEIDVLQEPIGYQDQWASALGGLNILRFTQDSVHVEQPPLPSSTVAALEANIHLIGIGSPRRARSILAAQDASLAPGSQEESVTRALVKLVDQGAKSLTSNLDDLGPLLAEAWHLKKKVSPTCTNPMVDSLYELGTRKGATGGKLLGAGGSGYLAFYVPTNGQEEFADSMPAKLPFNISQRGAGVIHDS